MLVKTVKPYLSKTVGFFKKIATDWVTGGYLQSLYYNADFIVLNVQSISFFNLIKVLILYIKRITQG